MKYPASPSVPLIYLCSKRDSLGARESSLKVLVSLGLSNWAGKGFLSNGTSRNLGVCQVGNAWEGLRPSSLSRTVTEMAFHKLNYFLVFKANTAQEVCVPFTRSSVTEFKSRSWQPRTTAATPVNQSHYLSHHRAIKKKAFKHICEKDADRINGFNLLTLFHT